MSKTLKLGATLPDITLKNQHNEAVRLHDYIGQNALVIYFYPKDETPGCTAEACSFRDRYEDFQEKGALVFGISRDSVQSHANFAKKHRLEFQLLSDPKGEAEKAFGVPRNLFGLLPGRVTYIFDQEGKLLYEFDSAIQVTKHISESLKVIEQIKH